MVLVSNEWPNKSEDEQKSTTSSNANATTATATTTTTTNAITPAATTTTNASNNLNTTTIEATTSNSITTTTTNSFNTDVVASSPSSITITKKLKTKTTATSNANKDQKEQEKEQNFDQDDGTSSSSTISDLEESENLPNELDNNNRNSHTYSSRSNNVTLPDVDDLPTVLNVVETPKDFDCTESDTISNTNTLHAHDHQSEHEQQSTLNSKTTANNRISSVALSTALNSAFKSMNVADNFTNKRSAPSTSATTATGALSTPATASNTLSNSYLATLGMGLSSHCISQAQQPQIKSGFTTITTNLHDQVNSINNNNNNNINNINNNINNNSNNTNNNNNNINAIATSLNSNTYTATATTPSSMTTNIVIDDNNQAKIILLCESNSHPFQTRTIPLTPNIECKVGRLIARSKANEANAIFDCKVLSRNHAVLWYSDDGKFWVKDTKSSNGTFINDSKLGNDAAELHFGDVVKFGVDVWENSRKEAHGCIIALVKLYLPDGREAISIDPGTQRTQYSGEGRISYDEMHRLNMFMQEAATREKGLKTKLCGIQNVLDTTRKNSALCWQSMVNEDQLLHRINSLEKKLQIMDKNVPESVLRNEVLKLLEDKNAYQITAKEALRKVYQERCDALQMLAKVEADYATAENECSLLREEITTTKQTMHEINARLVQLETEYNDYKDEIQRHQLEAKAKEEEHVHALHEQLQQREIECDNLHKQMIQLQNAAPTMSATQAGKMLGNVKNRKKKNAANASNNSNKDDDTVGTDTDDEEKEVIEKLDAAIGGFMNLDDDNEDDDDNDDEDGDDINDVEDEYNRSNNEDKLNDSNKKIKNEEFYVLNELEKALKDSETFNGDANNKLDNLKRKKKCSNKAEKDLKQKVVKKSTIMKWLKNSDLNKKEGSLDIFKAMFNNEDDSNEEEEEHEDNKDEIAGAGANNKKPKYQDDNHANLSRKEYEIKCSNFKSKLENVQNNLEQLETELANETNTLTIMQKLNLDGQQLDIEQVNVVSHNSDDDDDNDEDDEYDEEEHFKDEDADSEFIIKRNGATTAGSGAIAPAAAAAPANKAVTTAAFDNGAAKKAMCWKQNKTYLLLKQSVDMLREAFNEISNVKPQMQKAKVMSTHGGAKTGKYTETRTKHQMQPKSQVPDALQPLKEAPNESDSDESDDDNESAEMVDVNDEDEDYDEDEYVGESTALSTIKKQLKCGLTAEQQKAFKHYEHEIKLLEMQLENMRKDMQQKENDAQNTLEIMQIECENYKLKFNDLSSLMDTLRDEKQQLESVIKENKSNLLHSNDGAAAKTATTKTKTTTSTTNIIQIIESEIAADSSNAIESDTVADVETRTKTKYSKLDNDSNVENETNLSIDYCKSDANFEFELHEEHAAALALEREEELIAFKERLEQQQQINHKLLIEIDKLNQIAVCRTQQAVTQYILPIGAVAIAALVYFATQNIF